MSDAETEILRAEYRRLIHETLPAEITSPVRFDHCFARVVLDWLFGGVWYDHLDRPAYRHLTGEQLRRCVNRMEAWRGDRSVLKADNAASIAYRRKAKEKELPRKDSNLD